MTRPYQLKNMMALVQLLLFEIYLYPCTPKYEIFFLKTSEKKATRKKNTPKLVKKKEPSTTKKKSPTKKNDTGPSGNTNDKLIKNESFKLERGKKKEKSQTGKKEIRGEEIGKSFTLTH
ncbi:hypothetical protein RFI_06573 [Reticulomyxa filosa]|uniref:Uncharacterized protein n=1 Tax=Reticulomyxa filosa TaxID=46433 RepID=X6NZ42_RETFI|nr:hypothetical protein RFI_06573 [Reticulomyxa filosa]|eukprot:ETO30547.1 hypothetical protein RFI_06573 [Reticulomyxa filosa]